MAMTLLATGCIGSIDRDDFRAEVNARGGGLSGDQLVDFVAEVEERTGVSGLLIRSATLGHLLVTLDVSDPQRPAEVDSWTWSSGWVAGPDPEPNVDEEELTSAFPSSVLDAAAIESAIDESLARSTMRDPWATYAVFRGQPGGTFVASVSLTNERQDEQWTFGPDGTLLGGPS